MDDGKPAQQENLIVKPPGEPEITVEAPKDENCLGRNRVDDISDPSLRSSKSGGCGPVPKAGAKASAHLRQD